MAVLNKDRLACRVEERRIESQVPLCAAAVQLDRVESVVESRINIALVALGRAAVIGANAVVAVPEIGRDGVGRDWRMFGESTRTSTSTGGAHIRRTIQQ